MKIDLNLIKETRETTDWLLAFPDKLVSAVIKPRESFLRRRERIHRLKELVEIREIGKAIQSLYFFKGDLVQWRHELQSERRLEDAVHVRELFVSLKNGVADIRETVAYTSISNTSLGAEAALFLARAELVYQKLSELPDEILLDDKAIPEIARLLERIIHAASTLLKQLDEYRKLLDHVYGE
jgi:hypothetical protein